MEVTLGMEILWSENSAREEETAGDGEAKFIVGQQSRLAYCRLKMEHDILGFAP